MRLHCRWESPLPHLDLAVKRIHCSDADDVYDTRKERDVLYAARRWDHCVGSKGAFWEARLGKDGVRRGTTYHLAMECAPCVSIDVWCASGDFH